MLYSSTRGHNEAVSASKAILKGIAPDGGLYMPQSIPQIDGAFLKSLLSVGYAERAFRVLSLYLTDYDSAALLEICNRAYAKTKFGDDPAPVVSLGESGTSVLELWHGPTSAFKDMALQIMPLLLTKALEMSGETDTAYILVATSGDTGKAALEGYRDVAQTKLLVFYPEQGVSVMQKMQMATQQGENLRVQAIEGNFDDAQSGLKKIFADADTVDQLKEKGCFLSSANSINWGRLAPQIVYYISAYCDMVNAGNIAFGEKIDVCVPTGNFGNIFAGILAAEMGLPIRKFICASNKNNILTDFLATGIYDRNRKFYATMSPSMDILISSNLERLLYLRFGSEKTATWMKQLQEKGVYALTADEKAVLDQQIVGGWCDEEQTGNTIRHIFDTHHYLADTHTAVALYAAAEKATDTPMLVLSTASPYKFPVAVYASLTGETPEDDFKALSMLSSYSDTEIPAPIAALSSLPIRFTGAVDKSEMKKVVLQG